MSGDRRVEIARDFLTDAQRRSVEQMPPSLLMREVAELRRLLGQALGILAERQADTRWLSEIRAVLAAFDWQHDDRQIALEEIERAVTE
jgi:hypothetical protein